MNTKKLIKRCKQGDTVEKSDNTRVASPIIEEKPIYIQPQSKQTYVSADHRSPWQQQQDQKNAEIAYNKYIDEKNKEIALQHALSLATVADAIMLVPDATDLITKGIKLAGKKYLQHKNAKLVSSLLNGTPTVTPIANNVGWGPRYAGHVVHKSKANTPLVLYNPKRWDVVNEGANPHGVWYQGEWGVPRTVANATEEKAQKAARARAIFEERPYTHEGELVLEKPIITVGDVPDRSALSYQADALGADGLIYNNVYDNGYNNNQVILSFKKHAPQAQVKWYGPTMGKTTASKTKANLVDIDPLLKPIRAKHAERLGLKISDVKVSSDPAYKQEVADFVLDWRLKPENKGKTLVASTKHLLDPKYNIPFDNNPVIPDLETFIARNKARGFKESEEELRNWYNSIFQQNNNIQIDNRFVSDIESKAKHKTGGRLIPKHATGSPVNNNPLPKRPINTNPVPKKENKKLENPGIRPAPRSITQPRGNIKGYSKMSPYKN